MEAELQSAQKIEARSNCEVPTLPDSENASSRDCELLSSLRSRTICQKSHQDRADTSVQTYCDVGTQFSIGQGGR